MPDGHFGYGFPIGGVAAMDAEEGVISPGGIGFDINCGMRLVTTNLTYDEVKPYLKRLVDKLYERVPAGVGSTGFLKISRNEFRRVVEHGARWCVDRGYGWEEDLELTEESGCIEGADSSKISEKAIDRGFNQIGTLGSGNHYLEIQVAQEKNIFDEETARLFGITIQIRSWSCFIAGAGGSASSGNRLFAGIFEGDGEQVWYQNTRSRMACAPFDSPEGKNYFAAMKGGINMAFANRQVILHRIREVFSDIFGRSPQDLGCIWL